MSSKRTLLTVLSLFAFASVAGAGGPLIIYDPATRTPWSYPGTVSVYTDLGAMGPTLTNAEADAITAFSFAEWSGVATSSFSHSNAGDFGLLGLPDITGGNAGLVVGPFNGGGIHVLYDNDGTIIANFFGAPPGVLGIASPEFGGGGSLSESWAVMNGTSVDPLDTVGDYYAGVFTHEFGHAINLAHSQTNGAFTYFADDTGPAGCALPYAGTPGFGDIETMYPFIDRSFGSIGIDVSTVDVLDDIASISNVNPAAGWPSSFGQIHGTVYKSDGTTEVTGVNVIARNLADPFGDCLSALSGDYTQGALGADGLYRFRGLTPGADYVVYIDGIVAGGFSTTPAGVPAGAEEFHNGGSESNDPLVDDRCASTSITVDAGVTDFADVIINEPYLTLTDDGFSEVDLPFAFDFCGTVYNSVFVNGNGHLTFGAGDADFTPTVAEFLGGPPRISAIWADLSPQFGTVTAEAVGPDFVVTYTAVPEFDTSNINTFTITLHPNSKFTIDYGQIDTNNGIAGVTVGGGAPNPGETNLNTASQPIIGTTVYENFTGNDFDLDNTILEYTPCPYPIKEVTPLMVTFPSVVSGDTTCQKISVVNTGTDTLMLSSITGCDAGNFFLDLAALDSTVAPGDTTCFDICYTSTTPSFSDTCQVTLVSNADTCMVDVTVGAVTSVFKMPERVARTALLPAAPNPFRGATDVRFSLREASTVHLDVFDLSGRRVRTLIDGEYFPLGEQVVRWNGLDDRGTRVAAGIYLIRLRAPAENHVTRAVLIR